MVSMKSNRKAFLLLILFLTGLSPACSMASRDRYDQDDAMLLLISSYTVLLENGDTALGAGGGGRMLALSPQVTAPSTSEVDTLISIYSSLYNSNVEKVYERFPERADKLVGMLDEEYQAKVDRLLQQKQRLQAKRRRRRWGLFRRIGRGLARMARFIGRTTRTIVVEGGRLLAEKAINEIKQRVRDVFEGRVNAMIAKVAGKFGPLAPFVQSKLKCVLDRWWIRLRDRVSGRLAAQQRATQTAEARAYIQDAPPAGQQDGEENEFQISDFEEALGRGESGDCAGDGSWIDAYWNDTVVPALKEDRKNCANTGPYYSCLVQKSAEGLCAADVHEACESVYESLWTLPEGMITLETSNIFTNPLWQSAEFNMEFGGRGGTVSGTHEHVRVFDRYGFTCTYYFSMEFGGTFDTSTCLMQGSGTWTLELSEEGLDGECANYGCDWGHEGCTRSHQWALKLEDGEFTCVSDLSEGEVCNLRITMKGGG